MKWFDREVYKLVSRHKLIDIFVFMHHPVPEVVDIMNKASSLKVGDIGGDAVNCSSLNSGL